ncbi:unnamed protein product [Psylliodes chrysocephalus]|uniref:Uncharacterized protein n=1 Tax=Psylliodes chrysocephalus TaxID=3402493 RepID=A0A9P0GC76_9CUCU|nr:unnamed protein product [Psylliodes chrysocephala]
MEQNHPDIETIEDIREQILTDKEKEELYRLLRIEEKRMAAELKAQKELKKEQQKLLDIEEKLRLKEEKVRLREEHKEEQNKLRLEKAEQKRRDMLSREQEKYKKLKERKRAEEEAVQRRKETALKGMQYLLNISEKYSDFFRDKLIPETEGASKVLQDKNKLQPTVSDMKQAADRKSEKTASKGAIKKQVSDTIDVMKMLNYFVGGELRQYQIDGVKWMNTLFENGINGILADEMGLGKTVQIIALICHLMERKIPGPYLVIAPLSTIPNWESEFERFAPSVPVFVFHGSEHDRKAQYSSLMKKYAIGDFKTQGVILTTYQVPLLEFSFLSKFQWQYIIIDEGHRIKNHESRLAVNLRKLDSANRLLLTGTPIHNNITELWSLLHFLMPHIFNNVDTFASLLMLQDMDDENKLLEQEEKTNLISTLHRVLEPFVLRRLKKDVLGDNVPKKEANIYCQLSKLQRDLYSYVLNKNLTSLFRIVEEPLGPRRKRKLVEYLEDSDDDFSDEEPKIANAQALKSNKKIEKEQAQFAIRLTMGNPMMMFKKIVDHPYLVHFPLDPDAPTKSLLINEDLITSSGKMIVLEQMLERLKENGHKVLLFSTLVMTLDLIEEFFIMRDYTYRRLDGSHNLEQRKDSIDSFNNDPNILAFLISTRSGGLGLNLVGADTVIFFDRDWNPQVDIQAQDRCHRIGQTKPVMVYTLVSKGTIDEQIIETGHKKRLLEKVVIKDGKFQKVVGKKGDAAKLQSELVELQKLLKDDSHQRQALASIEAMEKLLDRSELYAQMNMKYKPVKRNNNNNIDEKENKMNY